MNQMEEQIVNKFKWYSLKVISGKELMAKENILFEVESQKVSEFIDNNKEISRIRIIYIGCYKRCGDCVIV